MRLVFDMVHSIYKKSKELVKSHWVVFLFAISFVAALLNILIFYPGNLSSDSIWQLEQAVAGRYSDWHPPVMAIIWHYLITLTGKVSSLLIFSISLLWASLFMMARVVFIKTGSFRRSLLPFLLGISPLVLSISGVLWKDVFGAFLILLTIALAETFQVSKVGTSATRKFKDYRVVYIVGTILIFISGVSMRHNLIIISPFMAAYFTKVYDINFVKRMNIKQWLSLGLNAGILTFFIILGFFSFTKTIDRIWNVEHLYPQNVLYVDDILRVASDDDILSYKDMKEDQRRYLVDLKKVFQSTPLGTSYILSQEARKIKNGDIISSSILSLGDDELKGLWTDTIIRHKNEYISKKIDLYKGFILDGGQYIWYPGVEENDLGVATKFSGAQRKLSTYVNFTSRDFGFIFRPYFWILNSVVLFCYVYRKRSSLVEGGQLLSLAGLAYILFYLPFVLAYDYRYIFPSVILISLAGIITFNREKIN